MAIPEYTALEKAGFMLATRATEALADHAREH